ncbi:fibronectin type III domain-containing protein [bacterium]|nr:fibronectin type III domain-containing protein [candidate division CSSED10-310 bacterium]
MKKESIVTFLLGWCACAALVPAALAGYCDCGIGTGRQAAVPLGIRMFDEDAAVTEEQEALLRLENGLLSECQDPDPADHSPEGSGRYMTDVIQINVDRADGYADRDGLWNDSDPYVLIWYQLEQGGWRYYGASAAVSGCNGVDCDAVFQYEARIAVNRIELADIDVEIWDDDGGSSADELLGKKDFSRVPVTGIDMGWKHLDDHPDWSCWSKLRIRYEDNGIEDPAWLQFPDIHPTSSAYFQWRIPEDRAGIHHSEIWFSLDETYGDSGDLSFMVWGSANEFVLNDTESLDDGTYFVAVRCFDNAGYDSDFIDTGQVFQWIAPTPAPPPATPTYTPAPRTPTPAPGAFVVGAIRIYADYFDDLGAGIYRARGNIRIGDYVTVTGSEAFLILTTTGTPWISGQGVVTLEAIDTPVFLGDFQLDPVAGHPQFGIIQPGEFTSLIIQILGFMFNGQPINLVVNVVEGWIYCETLIEIDIPEIGFHVTHADFVLDWKGDVSGTVTGFSFNVAGLVISFDQGYFNNHGIHVDYFTVALPPELGGGGIEAWGLNITSAGIWFNAAHIVLPVIRLEGGFEITGLNPNIGPEAWIEHLKIPYSGYKWCVDGRLRIPGFGDTGACGIETTFSIYGDRLQQACVSFEGCGLQIPIGTTGLFLYKLGGCVTFNNLPYPDPFNQCAVGTVYDCNDQVRTCCNFDFPDSVTIKLLAGLQGGPDIFGLKAVHADPLWLDINTGWGVGGGGVIRAFENFDVGYGRVCASPYGVHLDGSVSLAIIRGSLYLMITPEHVEGAIRGSVTIPPGDYFFFTLHEPIHLGQFLVMLGYYWVPESDFWGEGIWSTCRTSHCSGWKYGVLYSHEVFGQILAIAVDQNMNFYAWIDLNFFGWMAVNPDGSIETDGDVFLVNQMEKSENGAEIPVDVPQGVHRSMFTLNYDGGNPSVSLMAPDGTVIDPWTADNISSFYGERDGWRFFSIRNPQPGVWYFLLTEMEGVRSYRAQLLRGNEPPSIEIESVRIENTRASIAWTGDDPEDPARVSLFYDTDNRNADGIPIALSLGASPEDQVTYWDLTGIPTGKYYLYAKIEDGRNAPVISYYSEAIAVTDTVPPYAPGNLEGNPGDGLIHLWWDESSDRDIAFYEIRYNRIDGTNSGTIRTAGTDVYVDGLENNIPCRFVAVAVDLSGNTSSQSNELVMEPDRAGDLMPPDAVPGLQAVSSEDGRVIQLKWEASTAPDLSHYLISYGTIYGLYHGTEADQGVSPIRISGTRTECPISGLTPGTVYHFSIQAMDTSGNISDPGGDISVTLVSSQDTDSDGMPDDWESRYWASIDRTPETDADGDGISNIMEYRTGTNPRVADTDHDRIPDGLDLNPTRFLDHDSDGLGDDWEVYYNAGNAEADQDGDMLINLQEFMLRTNPNDRDSDRDGIEDGVEFENGSDPADPDDPNPRCTDTGVKLEMPSHFYHPGDPCRLNAILCNSHEIPVPDIQFFAVLEAYGAYFFAPGWTAELDYWTVGIDPGPHVFSIIPEFSWPGNVGSADGLTFYGILTDPVMQQVIGSYDAWTFGWSSG